MRMTSALDEVMKEIRISRNLVDPDPMAVLQLSLQVARAAILIKYGGHM